MLENLLLDIFIFICVIIGLSCVFIDFFLDMNDKINQKYKE